MPTFRPLRPDIIAYLKTHNLTKKWEKVATLISKNPSHPSLHTEILEPKEERIYSFRLDRKYRTLFIFHSDDSIEVTVVTNHYY